MPKSDLPGYLHSTWDVLERAYFSGIPDSDYCAVLLILKEHMSHRALADVMAEYTGSDWAVVFNDISASLSDRMPAPEATDRVEAKLIRHGLKEWIAEADKDLE